MKSYLGRSHKIVLALVIILGFFSCQTLFAANCTGMPAASCGNVGATSSTCANYYLSNGSSSIQCKWNGTSCSDGGTMCSAAGTTSKCTGTPAGSCSGIANVNSSNCSKYYLNNGSNSTQCNWNGSYCSNGGVKCSA